MSLALSAHAEVDHAPVPPKPASARPAEVDNERQPLLQHQTAASTASALLDPPSEVPTLPARLPLARLTILCAIFSLDAFASSLGPGSFIAYFLRETFAAPVALIASIFSVTSVVTCVSQLAAGSIAKRLGVVPTMVCTHVRALLPSSNQLEAPSARSDDVRLCRYRRSSSRSPSASPRPCRSPSPSSSPGPASPRWTHRCEVRLSRSSTLSAKEKTRDCPLTLACCSRRRLPLRRRPTQVSHQVPRQFVLFLLAQLRHQEAQELHVLTVGLSPQSSTCARRSPRRRDRRSRSASRASGTCASPSPSWAGSRSSVCPPPRAAVDCAGSRPVSADLALLPPPLGSPSSLPPRPDDIVLLALFKSAPLEH